MRMVICGGAGLSHKEIFMSVFELAKLLFFAISNCEKQPFRPFVL
jgi:hypothetical protein